MPLGGKIDLAEVDPTHPYARPLIVFGDLPIKRSNKPSDNTPPEPKAQAQDTPPTGEPASSTKPKLK